MTAAFTWVIMSPPVRRTRALFEYLFEVRLLCFLSLPGGPRQGIPRLRVPSSRAEGVPGRQPEFRAARPAAAACGINAVVPAGEPNSWRSPGRVPGSEAVARTGSRSTWRGRSTWHAPDAARAAGYPTARPRGEPAARPPDRGTARISREIRVTGPNTGSALVPAAISAAKNGVFGPGRPTVVRRRRTRPEALDGIRGNGDFQPATPGLPDVRPQHGRRQASAGGSFATSCWSRSCSSSAVRSTAARVKMLATREG